MQKILFVVAHPDDETLMGGALINKARLKGIEVGVATLASKAEARSTGAGPEKIASKQAEVFGKKGISFWNYDGKDSNLINEDHLKMVQFVEKVILEYEPDTIITHYSLDTHKDHQITSQIVSEAFRIKQRPAGRRPCEELWYGEVPSSTDWTVAEQFHPNVWVAVNAEDMQEKISMLATYDQVLRAIPHPRSVRNINAVATVRGAQCGEEFAEAFQQVFRIVS